MAGISIRNITREVHEIPAPKNHPFNQSYQQAVEQFAAEGMNITSARGYGAVMDDAAALESYKQSIFGDITNEDTKMALETIMENDNNVVNGAANGMITMEDGSSANVSIFSYLNGPVIRAIWARCIVPAVMKVVALKQTKYSITYDIPYAVVDGVKKELPYDMVDSADPIIGLHKLVPKVGSNPAIQSAGVISFTNNVVVGNLLSESLTETVTEFDGRAIDANIAIKNIKYNGAENADNETNTAAATLSTFDATIPFGDKTGKAGEPVAIVDIDDAYELVTTPGAGGADPTYSWEKVSATVMIVIDLSTGKYRATSTSSAIKSFEFEAFLSSEDNRTPIQVKTRQYSDTVTIGSGQHIMVDTPVELIQDYAPSHQGADYAVAMTDIISEFYAGNMNVEMLQFFNNSLVRPTSSQYIPRAVLRGLNVPDAEFDVRVAHGENPSAYTDVQLKRCLSYFINDIRSLSRIEDGNWNIVGHLNNLMYVPDFKTEGFASLNGDGDEKRQDVLGFKVGYSFGVTTNVINGTIKCISTPEIKQSSGMTAFFTSTDEKRPTYIFHPYSYTISRGYNNPNADALVPSLMVTKRHLFKEFVPSQFKLKLLNNDANQFKNIRSTTTV
jgi:hypothetical protein